jgi:hypothetical protein
MISALDAAGDLRTVSRRNSWIVLELFKAVSDRIHLGVFFASFEERG